MRFHRRPEPEPEPEPEAVVEPESPTRRSDSDRALGDAIAELEATIARARVLFDRVGR